VFRVMRQQRTSQLARLPIQHASGSVGAMEQDLDADMGPKIPDGCPDRAPIPDLAETDQMEDKFGEANHAPPDSMHHETT
jgi:hypothetical protein